MTRNDIFRLNAGTTLRTIEGLAPHPHIIEIVRLLARISAERDYKKQERTKE